MELNDNTDGLRRKLQEFLNRKYENSEIKNKYDILKLIGEGTYGKVYLIKDNNNLE